MSLPLKVKSALSLHINPIAGSASKDAPIDPQEFERQVFARLLAPTPESKGPAGSHKQICYAEPIGPPLPPLEPSLAQSFIQLALSFRDQRVHLFQWLGRKTYGVQREQAKGQVFKKGSMYDRQAG